MLRILAMGLCALAAVLLSACADAPTPQKTRWDTYYARTEEARAHVVVVPPEGTTVPMAKLIARYVVENLQKHDISAEVNNGALKPGRYFVLTGVAEDNMADPKVRYQRVLRWLLSDSKGRVIASHAQGIDGSADEWDYGAARLLEAIGINAAGPVAQMVLVETKATTPSDPLRSGLLVEGVSGVDLADSQLLVDAVKTALRTSDILVTGDVRQAAFRLTGDVQTKAVQGGALNVHITWTVATLDNQEIGKAEQENQIRPEQIQDGWAELAPRVGSAAALGVEHVFGLRPGPAPGAPNRARGEPPAVDLPGVPGRGPAPPQ